MKSIFWSILFFLSSQIYAQTGTFTVTYNISCGDSVFVTGLGYPFWNPPVIIKSPKYGFSELIGDFAAPNTLFYKAPYCLKTADSVIVVCAKATQITCDTGIYIFNISCMETFEKIKLINVPCNDTIYTNDLSGWSTPTLLTAPIHGKGSTYIGATDGGGMEYIPSPGFTGLDYAKVGIWGNLDTILYLFKVTCTPTTSTLGLASSIPLKIYPNPAEVDAIRIDLPLAIDEIQVYDMLGKKHAATFTQENGAVQLNISRLPSGIYSILAINNNKAWTGKLIKH